MLHEQEIGGQSTLGRIWIVGLAALLCVGFSSEGRGGAWYGVVGNCRAWSSDGNRLGAEEG